MAPLYQKLGALLVLGLSLTVRETAATSVSDDSHGARAAKLYSSVPRDNAFRIFNSVHSAMRQWGSSLDHNGFGFVPAIVPRGTVLYHGTHSNTTPTEPEWLAFELEHARLFARSLKQGSQFPMPPGGRRPPPDGDGPKPPPPPAELDQFALTHNDPPPRPGPPGDGKEPGNKIARGWFHVYQANRDLKLLYLDGMSGGKTDMGTLDTQDYVLRGLEPDHDHGHDDERERVADLCPIIGEWGFDGLIRMEIGFEVIMCDFSSGLNLISANRQPTIPKGGSGIPPIMSTDIRLLMVARAAAQRYEGIGAGRVRLDWSAATSALFYPVNISTWWPERPDLVRVGSASREDRMAIKDDVRRNAVDGWARRDSGAASVDWQGIVDMIVTRYSGRIASLASGLLTPAQFLQELREVIEAYVMYPPEDDDALLGGLDDGRITPRYIPGSCQAHYLLPATILRSQWTESDENYFTAIDHVIKEICSTFFAAKERLDLAYEQPDENDLFETVKAEVDRFRTLKRSLAWSSWVRCEKCQDDEVCYIAMWPFGAPEDHWTPQCKNAALIGGRRQGPDQSYWNIKFDALQADDKFGTMEL